MLVDKIIRVSFVRHDPLFCPSPRSPPVATTQWLSLSLCFSPSILLSATLPREPMQIRRFDLRRVSAAPRRHSAVVDLPQIVVSRLFRS